MKREKAKADPAPGFWENLIPIKGKIYNYIRKSLNFSIDSDDVYQETILRAYRYIQTFREDRNFEAWLFGIAHNEIRKHYRESTRVSIPIDAMRIIDADSAPNRLLVEEIYELATKLRPRSREVFFLFYDAGFSLKDIALITGLREGNIKFILNRVRNSLRMRLGVDHE